jgi:hypothetical protein
MTVEIIPTCRLHKVPAKKCPACTAELVYLTKESPIDVSARTIFIMRRDRSVLYPEHARIVADEINKRTREKK